MNYSRVTPDVGLASDGLGLKAIIPKRVLLVFRLSTRKLIEYVRVLETELLKVRDGDVILIEPWPWEYGDAPPLPNMDDVRTIGGFHAGKSDAAGAVVRGL